MITSSKQPALPGSRAIPAPNAQPLPSKVRRWAAKASRITGGTLIVMVALGWVGLQVQPAPFPAVARPAAPPATIGLPAGLPAPVERFYRVTYGEQIPIIKTAVVSGRGTMRLFGVAVPIRFRFTHEVGQNYRHQVDLTFFGLPLTTGYETFIDGHGWGKTPGGVDEGLGFDQGSNVSLWAEALNWFPAILATDPRVRWEPVDDTTALLRIPFGERQDVMVVRFDRENGKVQYVEAMKYNSATHTPMLWISGTWFHQGKPWLRLNVEDIVYNVPVDMSLAAKGP